MTCNCNLIYHSNCNDCCKKDYYCKCKKNTCSCNELNVIDHYHEKKSTCKCQEKETHNNLDLSEHHHSEHQHTDHHHTEHHHSEHHHSDHQHTEHHHSEHHHTDHHHHVKDHHHHHHHVKDHHHHHHHVKEHYHCNCYPHDHHHYCYSNDCCSNSKLVLHKECDFVWDKKVLYDKCTNQYYLLRCRKPFSYHHC